MACVTNSPWLIVLLSLLAVTVTITVGASDNNRELCRTFGQSDRESLDYFRKCYRKSYDDADRVSCTNNRNRHSNSYSNRHSYSVGDVESSALVVRESYAVGSNNYYKLLTIIGGASKNTNKSKSTKNNKNSTNRKRGNRESENDSESNSKVDKEPSALEVGLEKVSDLGNLALKFTKGTLKASMNLVTAKHVSFSQLIGKWRITQDIEIGKGKVISYPVSIQLLDNGTVISSFGDVEYTSTFKFREKQWPRMCRIEFQIRSYKAPGDTEPSAMLYRGYFKKSLLNPDLIFMRGKVYKASGKVL